MKWIEESWEKEERKQTSLAVWKVTYQLWLVALPIWAIGTYVAMCWDAGRLIPIW